MLSLDSSFLDVVRMQQRRRLVLLSFKTSIALTVYSLEQYT